MRSVISSANIKSCLRAAACSAAFLLPVLALAQPANEDVQAGFAGAEGGSWGGQNGAVIGLPDGTCANMGALGKINLVSNLGFDLPSDAVITHIEAFIKAAAQDGQSIRVQMFEDADTNPPVLPIGDFNDMPTFDAPGGSCAPTTFTSIGNGLAFWGTTQGAGAGQISVDKVNSPSFGMQFTKIVKSEVKVDSVCLQITYLTDETENITEGCEVPPGTLTLQKAVNGGSALPGDWTLTATGATCDNIEGTSGVNGTVTPDCEYTLTESAVGGYQPAPVPLTCNIDGDGALVDNVLTLAEGASAVCTFFNDVIPEETGTLTLVKDVNNNFNGTALDTAFQLSADGPEFIEGFEGDGTITLNTIAAGEYLLDEVELPGYNWVDLDCEVEGTGSLTDDVLTLDDGDVTVCTFTNNDIAPPPPDIPVPVDNKWALLALILMVLGAAWYFTAGRRHS